MLKRITSYVLIAVMLLCLMPVTVSADADWKTLYAAKIAEIEAIYEESLQSDLPYTNDYFFGHPYFSIQDINFDGVPELYHALVDMFELEPSVAGFEKIYYIKDGQVVPGKIDSNADFCLLPLGDHRKAITGDISGSRWQYVLRDRRTGEVCFITKDGHSAFVDRPPVTYSKLIFDSTTGVLSSKVLLHQEMDSYTTPAILYGYDFIGAECYTDWNHFSASSRYALEGWKLYDWKPCYTHLKQEDIAGQALHTDIVAYINHYAIPSYAVNGTSCIVAEDLRNYCFDVVWDNNTKSLNISRNSQTTPKGMAFSKTGAPATKFTDLLKTDISVYADGIKLTSYAMNGYTMIPIEELTVFGGCHWVSGERAIKLWVDGVKCLPQKQAIVPFSVMDNATIQAILDGKLTFTDFDTNKTATVYNWGEVTNSGSDPYQYTTIDLDCNGSNELIVVYGGTGQTAIITLMEGTLMAYSVPFRGFKNVKNDGSANFSNGASNSGIHKVRAFTYGGIVWDELIYSDSGDVSGRPTYRVNGKNTTEAAADKAYRAFFAKPDALWVKIQ